MTTKMKSKQLPPEKRKNMKSCMIYTMPPVTPNVILIKTIRSKLLKKMVIKPVLSLNPTKLNAISVLYKTKESYKIGNQEQDMLPPVKNSFKALNLAEAQLPFELVKRSLVITKIAPQPNIRFVMLQHTLRILDDRGDDIGKLKDDRKSLKAEKKIVSKVTAREKIRWKIEKTLLMQLKGERIHDKTIKKYFVLI